jgi:hypothetical protein
MLSLRHAVHASSLLALAFVASGACSPKDPAADGDDGGTATGGGTMSGGAAGTATGGTTTGGTAAGGTATGGAPTGGVAGSGTGGALGGAAGTGFSGGSAGVSAGTGGAPPTGGGAGLGGTAGSSPQGGAGAGGSAGDSGGGGKATGFLVEDFESGTVGQQPAGWDNFIAYQKNGPNPNGTTLALVDSTRAHGGTKSVKFHGGSNPAMITKPLPANTARLYVRAWIYITRQLGMNPGANHETLIGIRKTSGNANDEVRFGEIKGVIGTNEVPTDNISPKMERWGMGPVVPANTWACIEVAFLGDLPTHELRAWHNGTLIHEITSSMNDQWQNGPMPSAAWMSGKFNEIILGWQSFSSADVDLWMDDLILSNSPIGCN